MCSNHRNCERNSVCIVSEITCVSCSTVIFGGARWLEMLGTGRALRQNCKVNDRRMPRNVVFGALRQQPCESMTMLHDATALGVPNGILCHMDLKR